MYTQEWRCLLLCIPRRAAEIASLVQCNFSEQTLVSLKKEQFLMWMDMMLCNK